MFLFKNSRSFFILVCQMIRYGVAAIIGPQSEASADHVQSMCQTMKIPHIQTHWDPKRLTAMDVMKSGSGYNNGRNSNSPLSVNLYPHPASVSRVRINECHKRIKCWNITADLFCFFTTGLCRCNHGMEMENFHRPLRRRRRIDSTPRTFAIVDHTGLQNHSQTATQLG